jgi:hypothetical protein
MFSDQLNDSQISTGRLTLLSDSQLKEKDSRTSRSTGSVHSDFTEPYSPFYQGDAHDMRNHP